MAAYAPPATGFVNGLHPIRPGAPTCSIWANYGRCDYLQNCPCNHPPAGGGFITPAAAYAALGGGPYPRASQPQGHIYRAWGAGPQTWQQQQMMMMPQQPYPTATQPVYNNPQLQPTSQYHYQQAAAQYAAQQQRHSSSGGSSSQAHYQQQYPAPAPPAAHPPAQQPPPPPPPQQQQQRQQQQQHAYAPSGDYQQQQQQQLYSPRSNAEPSPTSAAAVDSTTGHAMGTALLGALQQGHNGNHNSNVHNNHNSNSNSNGNGNDGGAGSSSAGQSAWGQRGAAYEAGSSSTWGGAAAAGRGGGNSGEASSSSAAATAPVATPSSYVQPNGVYLQGIPATTTKQQLEDLCSQFGTVIHANIIAIKHHTTKSAFVVFRQDEAAQQALSMVSLDVEGHDVRVLPKIVKAKPDAGVTSQDGGSSASATASASATTTALITTGPYGSSLGTNNTDGLPQRRAVCCPHYMGTSICSFGQGCKYHHPNDPLHPECVAQGRMPQKPKHYDLPSYARLVNFVERLWDYTSCVESQLKIWLARHLLAGENSGLAMWSECAAVPAAPEYAEWPDEQQPLGPYSCTVDDADRMLQALWKIQPDEASQVPMPYEGRVYELLRGDPYFELSADPHSSSRQWVQFRVGRVKELLNY